MSALSQPAPAPHNPELALVDAVLTAARLLTQLPRDARDNLVNSLATVTGEERFTKLMSGLYREPDEVLDELCSRLNAVPRICPAGDREPHSSGSVIAPSS